VLRLPLNIPQSTVDEIKALTEDPGPVSYDPQVHDGTGEGRRVEPPSE
jgi:hypothetical protein